VCRDAGTDTPHIMPATLMSLFSGINMPEFYKGDQHKQLMKAIADGHFTQEDRHLPGMFIVNQTTANLNGGHLFKMNALKCKDLTEGIMLGRKIVQEYKLFYQKYMPGCENIELVITANVIGVRESRRILGEYELNYDDYMERRKFPDQIGIFCKFIDIHPYDTSKEEWERFSSEAGYIRNGTQRSSKYEVGEYFGIPYGILVPKGWKNFWVAGRCASSDVRAHGSIRVQPACSMMGQAAGTAAVQSIKTGQPANELDTEMLVLTLRKAGAYLPQDSLTKKMTRNET
ncbi:MAG: FAD-dependent oxidoreductase, partial [Planctomycetaceae bacterium]|nr:FAD-dependent oxidoreductase [Planctomycetaceae bacterium]